MKHKLVRVEIVSDEPGIYIVTGVAVGMNGDKYPFKTRVTALCEVDAVDTALSKFEFPDSNHIVNETEKYG